MPDLQSTPRIVLADLTPGYASRTWSSPSLLRIGRLPDQEVVLDGESIDTELQLLLDEAVAYFGAQRGGILLAANADSPLVVQCASIAHDRPAPARKMSRTPAARAFQGKESLLFADAATAPELAN